MLQNRNVTQVAKRILDNFIHLACISVTKLVFTFPKFTVSIYSKVKLQVVKQFRFKAGEFIVNLIHLLDLETLRVSRFVQRMIFYLKNESI